MSSDTEEHRCRQILESLPVGVYQLDENENLVKVNVALVKMLGYETPSEIELRSIKEFYLHTEGSEQFRQTTEGHSIIRRKVKMLRKDGDSFVASVIAHNIASPDGRYIGQEGVILDVTKEERYREFGQAANISHAVMPLMICTILSGLYIGTDCTRKCTWSLSVPISHPEGEFWSFIADSIDKGVIVNGTTRPCTIADQIVFMIVVENLSPFRRGFQLGSGNRSIE